MKKPIYVCTLLTIAGLSLCGCRSDGQNDQVVSQRYIHKYGYVLSKAEWNQSDYPGQVITNLKDGVTVTETYENSVLHGPTTYTFPHSQTVQHFYLYNQGVQVKEIHYNPMGMPVQEKVQLSPSRYAVTMWYHEGTPLLIEEFVENELLEGQYFTAANEIESRVEKGCGVRTLRDASGVLLMKEDIEQGFAAKRQTFYPNGAPESVAHYSHGLLDGEKKTFAQGGEPLSIEFYSQGHLHGTAAYFANGNKYLETPFFHGQKHGIEKHFVDGDILTQEVSWENGLRHGPTQIYLDNHIESQWFYAGDSVSKRKFDELTHLDEIISQIPPLPQAPRR